MQGQLNEDKPIFQQVKEWIEDQIINQHLAEHEQVPSTTQLVQFYRINHITVAKGINLLVDQGILYKKRGIGMFVAPGARDTLIQARRTAFAERYIVPLVHEATKLGISENELRELIHTIKERDAYEL